MSVKIVLERECLELLVSARTFVLIVSSLAGANAALETACKETPRLTGGTAAPLTASRVRDETKIERSMIDQSKNLVRMQEQLVTKLAELLLNEAMRGTNVCVYIH